MKVFFVLFLLINVQLQADEVIEGAVEMESETFRALCPKKGEQYCKRLKKCITLCGGCRAPIIEGNQYKCGRIKCREYETCSDGITCIGKIAGNEYFYRPSDNNPCNTDL